jgi:hypothetical protein
VPDWNQPYRYTAQSLNGGPGPDPAIGVVNQWNAWCAPSSGANLAGHWTDYHLAPVADATAYPGSTVWWTAGPSWQDYLADGTGARPGPQGAPGPLPVPTTDIGWYMDTNLGILWDNGLGVMGGWFFGNFPHTGTYLKDIHAGLGNFLDSQFSTATAGWNTGTRGKMFAAGLDPTGGVATVHGNAVSAFSEVQFEINRNHTLLLSYLHWNLMVAPVADLAPTGTNTESVSGGSYYVWGQAPGPGVPNYEDEEWNLHDSELGLGHVVTAVGYIPAGDVLDAGLMLGLGPTDWVIVHDNWWNTPRNVIIPFDYAVNWVANSTAWPDPGFLQITGVSRPNATNAVISFTGIPAALHDLQWLSSLLVSNTWSTAMSNITYSAGTIQLTNTFAASEKKRFYRINARY